MSVCVWQPTPKTADVTVTKMSGYVRVRILMNWGFFRIFGIHSFYATATLLNMSLSPAMNMWLTDAADGGCADGLDFAPNRVSRSKVVANDCRHQHGCGL